MEVENIPSPRGRVLEARLLTTSQAGCLECLRRKTTGLLLLVS